MAYLAREDRTDEVTEFVQRATGVYSPVSSVQVMGFVDDDTDDVSAAFMFERYTGPGGSVHIHWAVAPHSRGLTRDMMRLVAIYLFDQLKVDVVYGEVRAGEKKTREIDERLGFVQTAVLPAYFPDDDLVIYSITKRQCEWLPAAYKEPLDG